MKNIKYLNYVIRHRWFVMLACFSEGLFWRGLTHDLSKLLPSEFIPYANFFYGKKPSIRDKTGYYKPTDTGDKDFDFAWLLHQKRNDHHWQWWILPEDEGGIKVLPMSPQARLEMVCDWVGAGKAQGHFPPKDDRFAETRKWYQANNHKMSFHQETKQWIENKIGFNNQKYDPQ